MTWLLALALTAAAHDGSVRGITVSCPTWGHEWGSDAMVDTLDELAGLGVNWVAIHPYARIHANGEVTWRAMDPANPPEWIARPIAEAQSRGMKVLIKPHLAYWGSPFSWRGEIAFEDEEDWARFFTSYEAWMREIAQVSTGADALAVGTELDKTVHRDEWTAVIGGIREHSPAALTYAANWTDYERVPFWAELDAVGVQAYFPLVDEDESPTAEALTAGWDEVLAQLVDFAERTDKPVVLTELGYPRATHAAHTPWEHGDDPAAEAVQTAALATALRALDREPQVIGAFLWKWFPGERPPRDFALQRPGARAVLEQTWAPRSSPGRDAKPADGEDVAKP